MDNILVIITGGRIDSVWDGGIDEIVVAKHSVLPEYFKALKIAGLEFREICMKDSRALTKEDRKNILRTIQDSSAEKILITHGTHTLVDTVEFLEANLKDNSKTIILTGSSIPLKDFALSDAPFNLGYALAKVEELPAGIYFCTNRKTLRAQEIKNQF
jgi:L-asparaginase